MNKARREAPEKIKGQLDELRQEPKGDAKMKLVNESTKEEVTVGDTILDFRGERHIVKSFAAPGEPGGGRGGRVYVDGGGFYPQVFNLLIVEG